MGKYINVIVVHTATTRSNLSNPHVKDLLEDYTRVLNVAYESAYEAYKARNEIIEKDFNNIPKNAENKRKYTGGGDGYIQYYIGKDERYIRYEVIQDIYLVEKDL